MRIKVLSKSMFEDTIFNNEKVVIQKEHFEYSHILIPLNKNPEFTILVWERLFKLMAAEEDESSLWNSDME